MPKPITETTVATAQDENLVPVRKPAPAKKAPAKKAPAKAIGVPAAAKKAPAKNAPAKAGNGEQGVHRSHDVPWSPKKVSVFKALKGLRATSQLKAVSAQAVVDKDGTGTINTTDVRHYCYHAKAGGLTDVVEVEGIRGYAFYLTPAGAAVNPDAELKALLKAKATK